MAKQSLDVVDRQIVELLVRNARISNHAIAEAVSIAESTSYTRVRALVNTGVIKGFHADVDFSTIGQPLRAMILVQVHSNNRSQLLAEAHRIAEIPGVLEVQFLAGSFDLMIQAAFADSATLRDFVVEELSSSTAIASTNTSVVMDTFTGSIPIVPAGD
ncbi:MAG: Lrp/AsnC family transcriptional regulator [Propionibacteriaceae bacterium]|jgi:DNA-binding Lrp family transcriptional regulator|nr:Lrp/AsnC family transcriptional regulator [Propionibacteriaceae bacterium]